MAARIGTDVGVAADLLSKGQLVAIPTETVYGLAADAFNEVAVMRVFQAKQRPRFDPLIVHLGSRKDLHRVVRMVPPGAAELIEAFWPGPLTLVLPKHPDVPDLVTSGLDTVAVRMPSHPMTQQLLYRLGSPLAAPSANPFGYVSPTTAEHVDDQMGEEVAYILDGGPCTVGIESTILGWEPGAKAEQGRWVLLRPGGVPVEDLLPITGTLDQISKRDVPAAPGMLSSHYAPHKPTHVGDVPALMLRFAGKAIGVIGFRKKYDVPFCEVLSERGDLSEAARNLFGAMRKLDQSECEVILAEVFPSEGFGLAINDRLHRAATTDRNTAIRDPAGRQRMK